MSQETQPMTYEEEVVSPTGVDFVTIRRGLECPVSRCGVLTLDIYYPPEARASADTAGRLVLGYSDLGFRRCSAASKEMESYTRGRNWRLLSGLVALTYQPDNQHKISCIAGIPQA